MKEEPWDDIILQQVSGDSGIIESFYPYIKDLQGYVKEKCSESSILLHQTWAYEWNTDHKGFIKYDYKIDIMQEAIVKAYKILSKDLDSPVVRSGDLLHRLSKLKPFNSKVDGMNL